MYFTDLRPAKDPLLYLDTLALISFLSCVEIKCLCGRVVQILTFTYRVFQTKDLPKIQGIKDAWVLLNFGDSVTTDHISPAGSIARNSPAARYLAGRGYVTLLSLYLFLSHDFTCFQFNMAMWNIFLSHVSQGNIISFTNSFIVD